MAYTDDPVEKAIVTSRVKFLFQMPWLGNLSLLLEPTDASSWCETIATNGKCLFYNREFVKSLTQEELNFEVAHQVMHLALDHVGRRAGREEKIWNAAIDYLVNRILVDSKIGKMPKGELYDTQYTQEMTAEEVYRKIFEDVQSGKTSMDQIGSGLDQHIDPDKSDTPAEAKLTDDQMAEMRARIMSTMINSSQNHHGDMPMGIVRMLAEFTNPTINWRELLAEDIQSKFKDDYSFNRPSKRSFSSFESTDMPAIILPSTSEGKMVQVAASLDTSGSIGNLKFTSFLSEIKNLLIQYENWELHLWCIDSRVHNYKIFKPDNASEIDEYTIQGGGGNDFSQNYIWLRDHAGEDGQGGIVPDTYVEFSDGGVCENSWGEAEFSDYCNTIHIISNSHMQGKIEAPFGRTVFMDDVNDY
jgi:predicted metal-dependent peptidase